MTTNVSTHQRFQQATKKLHSRLVSMHMVEWAELKAIKDAHLKMAATADELERRLEHTEGCLKLVEGRYSRLLRKKCENYSKGG